MNVKKIGYILNLMEDSNYKMFEHSGRVAMLCYAFARELKLEPEYLEIAYMSGLLHEVGKIGFEKYVKIGKDNIELEKIYPYISKAIIDNFEGFESVGKVIIQSSEKYDGTGYPFGLAGEEIGEIAIILIISDYYDTQRMKGYTHDETTKLLRENSDIIFPKKIITPFIKSIINNDLHNEYYVGDKNE